MTDYSETIEVMRRTALQAASVSQHFFLNRHKLEVGFKGPADLICKADLETEETIRRGLASAFPDYAYRGEELGIIAGRDSEYEWFVDPIDGTTNFLSGMHYMISIALKRQGKTVCGVLYNPVADEMFTAIAGEGAFLNGDRIFVSETSDAARFVIGTGIPTSNLIHSKGAYERLEAIREPISGIRILGSCANSLAHVAAGRLDGFFEGPTGLVDFAVGVLLVQEAGGVLTDYWGKEEWEQNLFTVAGNANVHGFLVDRLNGTGRD